MATHEIVLGLQWLYSVLSPDSVLNGYAPGGVHRGIAPDGAATPFVIIGYQSGMDKTTMNAKRIMSNLLYQVRAVGPATQTTAIANAASRIDVLLDRKAGAPSGGLVLSSSRESPLQYDEPVAGVQWSNFGGLYILDLQQT